MLGFEYGALGRCSSNSSRASASVGNPQVWGAGSEGFDHFETLASGAMLSVGSSAVSHENKPISGEILVTLARFNAVPFLCTNFVLSSMKIALPLIRLPAMRCWLPSSGSSS